MNADELYCEVARKILVSGEESSDRTGVGTKYLFGEFIDIDMRRQFPLLTCKKTTLRGTFEELKWFLSGSTRVSDLHPDFQKWWTPWMKPDGTIGPSYGMQLRNCNSSYNDEVFHVDQISDVVEMIMKSPNSRRIVATTWCAPLVEQTGLHPCHGLVIHFNVHSNNSLSLLVYQRSADWAIGVPINIASYGLLLQIVCEATGKTPNRLKYVFGNAHIYNNHVSKMVEVLERHYSDRRDSPRVSIYNDGKVGMDLIENIEWDMIDLQGYDPHPAVTFEIAK